MTELEIRVVRASALSPDLRREMLELCSRAYQEDFTASLRSMPDATHVLAFREGALASHALWITRWLEVDKTLRLRTAYVEAVATDPLLQNRGYGAQVMRRLQASIEDFDLAVLSPSEPRWYARLGWESWRGPLFIRIQDGVLPTPGEAVMIFRLPRTPALSLEESLSAEWREGELW